MTDQDPLAESIAAMGRFYIGESTLVGALQHVVDLSAVAVPPARYAGISMFVADTLTTSVYSDPDVPEIDQAQYQADSGPCVDALRDAKVYEIPSTEHDDRWPDFSGAALAHGIRSTLSLPLVVDDRAIGALNMYAETTGAFTDDHRRAAQLLVIQACSLLAYAQARDDARTLAHDLSAAMASRRTIEQAKGILMAANRCSLDQAFDILVRASQRENRKLRDIAAALVERYNGPASEGGASRGAPDQRFA